MAKTKLLFSTPLYQASLSESGPFDLGQLEKSCWSIAQEDEAGQKWCDENNYPGYTSYCLLYTSPSPRDGLLSRMPSSA